MHRVPFNDTSEFCFAHIMSAYDIIGAYIIAISTCSGDVYSGTPLNIKNMISQSQAYNLQAEINTMILYNIVYLHQPIPL